MNRQFETLYILLNEKNITAKYLAEYFGISQRTVYRDIDTLCLAGIPVYTERGKGGGISLLPEFVLNKSILSEQEQHDILSALQGLVSVKAVETDQSLKKLSAMFNKSAANWLEVDFSDWSNSNSNLFTGFKTAILEKRIAEFDYYSTYEEKTHRRIEPVQLWFKSKAWYVKGFCLTRQDMRVFKLVRIKKLTIQDEHFNERDLLTSSPSIKPKKERQKKNIAIKLKIAPEMTYRVYDEFDENDAKKQSDGSFIVSVTWPEDVWVYSTILSFGEHIEVLSPKCVQKIIKEKSQKIASKYV